MRLNPLVLALALSCVGLVAACAQTFTPYDGSAWPSRRPGVPAPDGGGPVALVSDNGSDTLSIVDLAGPRTIGRMPLGIDPLANDGPHHLAVDPTAGVLFTALAYPAPAIAPGPHGNHGRATLPGVVVRMSLSDLRETARAEVDIGPGDVVLTPDRTRLLVTHFDLNRALDDPSRLYILRASDLRVEAVVAVGVAAHGLVISPDGRRAYITCYGSDELAIVSLDDPNLAVELVPVGPGAGVGTTIQYGPYAATISPDGATVWVSDLEGQDVRAFDTAMRRFDPARTVALRAGALFSAFGPDDRTLLVPTQSPDALVAVRTDTLETTTRRYDRTECQLPHQVARSPDGRYFVVCEGDYRRGAAGAVLEIDPVTLETRGRTEVGVYPDSIVFLPGLTR